jgi:pimeloyl-ACP methyl ester carboxylesterase
MNRKTHLHVSDIRGYSQLAIDATVGITDLVEAMHQTILTSPGVLGVPAPQRTGGITGFVYKVVRGITWGVGSAIDLALQPLQPLLKQRESSPAREAVVAALNGVLGDHLEMRNNPLCIEMQLRRNGQALTLTPDALASAIPGINGKILLLVHGLCIGDRQWLRNGHEHGESLARDLGVTTIYVNYNSGLPVASNGRAMADLLERLIANWPVPVEQLDILGYSMGGLLARSACHYAKEGKQHWLKSLRKIVFLGTPHHGAPLERGGNWVNTVLDASPYTTAFSRLAKIRSAGITDLRYGHLLAEEAGLDEETPDRFANLPDSRPVVPLPHGVTCYAIAGVIADNPDDVTHRFGDGLVLNDSALGQHREARRCLAIPKSRQWTGHGMHHLDLLDRKEVYTRLREFLG